MDRQEIQKLLGGYATGTLTREEQQILFTAALEDQELFDALAREQSLKDLLADPAARGQLLASIDDRPAPWYRRFWRPLTVVAAAAACVVGFGIFVNRPKPQSSPVLVAEVRPADETPRALDKLEPSPAAPASPPAPAPKIAPKPVPIASNEPVRRETAAAPPPPPAQPVPAAAPAASQPAAPKPAGLAGAPLGGTIAEAPKEMAKKAEVQLDEDVRNAQNAVSARALLKDQAAADAKVQMRDAFNKSLSLQSAQAFFNASSQDFDHTATPQYFAPQRQEQKAQQTNQQVKQQQALETLQGLSALAGQKAVIPAGVKWTVLRRRDGGDFVEVEPSQLRAGDSVKLRLTPNVDGYLTVWERGQSMMGEMRVERLKQFETPVITANEPVRRTLTVQLTQIAQNYGKLVQNVSEQQSVTDSAQHATYVLNTVPYAPVQAVIPLQFR